MRGLKHDFEVVKYKPVYVAPLVGAWIETFKASSYALNFESHPSWVRGLKLLMFVYTRIYYMSHPSWVRGLKLEKFVCCIVVLCRTPRGCVD